MSEAVLDRPWYRQLHWQVLIAMALGAIYGLIFREAGVARVAWAGEIFIRLLTMVVVPLIFTSIVSGVASVGDARNLGRLGLQTFAYYVVTSLLAIVVGLFMVNLLRPGANASFVPDVPAEELPELDTPDSLGDIFFRMIPDNPVAAMATGDVLAVIFFSILLGFTIARLGSPHGDTLIELFNSGFQLMMKLTQGIIALAPFGVFGLIARTVGQTGLEAFRSVGLYMLTVALALSVHAFVSLPLLLRLVARVSPRQHFTNMAPALATAFSTSSSNATLPVTLETVEQRAGVSNKISSFVLPMGATINMDGTALYECIGAMYIAQALGYDLDLTQQFTVVVTALLASIGAAGIPSAGLVMIFIVTSSVGLTGPEVAAIVGTMLAIDRPLDMYRTMVNVLSDSAAAVTVARFEGELDDG